MAPVSPPSQPALLFMDREGNKRRLVTTGDGTVPAYYRGELYWAPDGGNLLYIKSVGRTPGGDPILRLFRLGLDGTDLGPVGPLFHRGVDISSRGRIAAVRVFECGLGCWHSSIYSQQPGGAFRRVTRGPGDNSPAWSPHGKKIAFTRSPASRARDSDLYPVRRNGRGLRRLTRRGGHRPRWSPDGRYLAFIRGTQSFEDSYLYTLDLKRRRLRRYIDVGTDYAAVTDFDWARN